MQLQSMQLQNSHNIIVKIYYYYTMQVQLLADLVYSSAWTTFGLNVLLRIS